MKRAHPLQDIVDAGYAPSVRWLQERLRAGEIPGIRVARKGRGGRAEWRMTDADIEAFIESRRNTPTAPSSRTLNLTPAAQRRLRSA